MIQLELERIVTHRSPTRFRELRVRANKCKAQQY